MRNLTHSALLIVLGAGSGSARVHAQQATNCGTAGGVVITGRIVDARTGSPVAESRVHLLLPLCNSRADEDGRFRFEGVRPGTQRLDAGHAGYRDFKPVSHTVAAGDSLDVKLLLEPGGPIEDCLADANCARLLQDPPAHLTDAEALRLMALATGIAIAWQRAGQQQPWWACVDEQSSTIIDELKKRYQHIADYKDCEAEPLTRGNPSSQVAVGRAIFRVRVYDAEAVSNTRKRAFMMIGIGSAGEGWECVFDSTAKRWTPSACKLVGQS